ncbi:MAG: respiratory nitrate reductase subunit gamma [candidate division WOR-3 bacterium]
MNDLIFFAIFPYISLFIAIIFSLYRYFSDRFSFSSLSSQFLESKKLFYGSIGWHYGIIIILFFHLLALLFPDLLRIFLKGTLNLYFFEITGLGIAIFTFFSLFILFLRRILDSRIISVSSFFDYLLIFLLLIQVLTGIYIAIFKRWGALWSLDTVVPYLLSLLKFKPDISYIKNFPFLVKLHFFNAFLLIFIFPFTRLIHIFTFPVRFVIRPYQLVVWNRRR